MRRWKIINFIVFSMLMLGLTWSLRKNLFMKNHNNNRNLTIALKNVSDISNYDPADLRWAADYNLIRGLFSPLVELRNNNQIVSGVADEFYWDKNDLVFHIRDNFATRDGYKINASDAYYSLKRLMIIDTNVHGDLNAILNCKNKITSLDDVCVGLSYDDDKRELRLTPKNKSPMLLYFFTSIDFVVLPTIIFNNKELKIMDYKNTTGPYFYNGKDNNGNIILSENKSHWHISSTSPTTITIVNDKLENNIPISYNMFLEGKVDSIPTVSLWETRHYNDAVNKTKENIQIHKTEYISVSNFSWTSKGKKYSAKIRRGIGNAIQAIFHHRLNILNKDKKNDQIEFMPAYQFFPNGAHGSLSLETLEKGKNLSSSDPQSLKDFTLTIWLRSNIGDGFKKTFNKLPLVVNFITNENNKSSADIIYQGQDLSYEEDISLISYCLSTGTFNSSNNKEWLNTFMSEDNATDRVRQLKELHYRSVFKDPSVIPIMHMRYYAVSQNGWKMNFAKHWARSPYWQYSKED